LLVGSFGNQRSEHTSYLRQDNQEGKLMPNVTIEWVEGRDKKTKAEVARRIVEVLDQVAGVPPSSTNVLFLDYDAEDWFIAHESIAEIRKKREKK
jgi:phenylpyruvate tautomerase PptA (4-oxalocrotonate tautomerase family)